jgi:hypothetical protein
MCFASNQHFRVVCKTDFCMVSQSLINRRFCNLFVQLICISLGQMSCMQQGSTWCNPRVHSTCYPIIMPSCTQHPKHHARNIIRRTFAMEGNLLYGHVQKLSTTSKLAGTHLVRIFACDMNFGIFLLSHMCKGLTCCDNNTFWGRYKSSTGFGTLSGCIRCMPHTSGQATQQ